MRGEGADLESPGQEHFGGRVWRALVEGCSSGAAQLERWDQTKEGLCLLRFCEPCFVFWGGWGWLEAITPWGDRDEVLSERGWVSGSRLPWQESGSRLRAVQGRAAPLTPRLGDAFGLCGMTSLCFM